jgi:multidrug transporter EmrE-like cation transporter
VPVTKELFSLRVLLLSLLAVLANVAGNFLLSIGVKAAQEGPSAFLWNYFRQPTLFFGVGLLISWLLLRLALLSATDMSLVLPVTAGLGYILTSLVGEYGLKETVHSLHNVGLVMIALGVAMIGMSTRVKPS